MKKILVITENKITYSAFTSMLNKNIPFKRVSESPKESLLENDELKVRVVIKDVDIDTFAYDEVLSLTRDGLVEIQLRNIAEVYVEELSIKDNKKVSPLIKIHTNETLLNKEEVEKMMKNTAQAAKAIGGELSGIMNSCTNSTEDKPETEEQLKSMRNDDSEEKSENNYLNLNIEEILDAHSIQLQMLNSYERAYSPKELTHLLNSIANLDVISKWNEDYQSILDEKLKDIQKFILNKIGYHLKLNEFNLVDGWTEVLIELESKMF